jgi:hypothetical protein
MTIQLQEWATRWAISPAALADLLHIMGVVSSSPPAHEDPRTSEAYVQSLVRGEAPRYGVHLWRNNVGAQAIVDEKTGQKSFIRWGLANESAQQNKTFKSGDLIGWRSFIIEPKHVGARFAQFVSRECKKVGWTWSGNEHELAQLNWANLVTKAGGDARFTTGEGSFL